MAMGWLSCRILVWLPELHSPKHANHSGHLQTAYIVVGNFSKTDNVEYVRTMIRVPDGGTM